MSTFDEHRARSERQQGHRRRALIVDRGNRLAGERLGFEHIGRHDRRQRKQPPPDRVHRPLVQETRAAFRDHHRVEDDVRELVARDRIGDSQDDRRRREHADFGGVNLEVGRHGIDLRDDHRRVDLRDRGDAERVLRGDRGNRGTAVDAVRGERLEVGLDAGAAARVAAGDCQRRSHLTFRIIHR